LGGSLKPLSSVPWLDIDLVEEMVDLLSPPLTVSSLKEAQHHISHELHQRRLTIVGDEEQTLYGYRAVEHNSLTDPNSPKMQQIALRNNYGSTQGLTDFCATIFHGKVDRVTSVHKAAKHHSLSLDVIQRQLQEDATWTKRGDQDNNMETIGIKCLIVNYLQPNKTQNLQARERDLSQAMIHAINDICMPCFPNAICKNLLINFKNSALPEAVLIFIFQHSYYLRIYFSIANRGPSYLTRHYSNKQMIYSKLLSIQT